MNAYFADGIQDDVLTMLAKIGDLKVISRTSVMAYKGLAHNIKEIGRALGVSAILEGSVGREGNRVRVNVQLIEAATDHHLWAEVYERDLTDIFAIQSALSSRAAVRSGLGSVAQRGAVPKAGGAKLAVNTDLFARKDATEQCG